MRRANGIILSVEASLLGQIITGLLNLEFWSQAVSSHGGHRIRGRATHKRIRDAICRYSLW